MRVLVNATNLVKGGALQVAAACIREIFADPQGIDWTFALSPQAAQDVERLSGRTCPLAQVFESSPARHQPARRALADLARQQQVDCVFTVFGPAYVDFSQKHLMGCATPWVTNSTWLSYQTVPGLLSKLHMFAWSQYCAGWLKRAQAWVTESPAVRAGMVTRLGLPESEIAVVSNTCAQPYFAQQRRTAFPGGAERIRLLCFSAPYPHKCIDLIPAVAAELARCEPGLDFEFVVTLPPADPLWQAMVQQAKTLGISGRIVNRGPIAVADGPALYQDCHICFMPTVLECFTATYPEAWAMGLPVITSNLDFARAICGDAALFFTPRNASAAVEQIRALLASKILWNQLVESGKHKLPLLPTPRERYLSFVELLRRLHAGVSITTADDTPATIPLRRAA